MIISRQTVSNLWNEFQNSKIFLRRLSRDHKLTPTASQDPYLAKIVHRQLRFELAAATGTVASLQVAYR